MQTEGTEKCSRALDTVVQMPEARDLFSESLDRFRDVTCVGLCNWANVHLCLAKKLLEQAAVDEENRFAGAKSEFESECAKSLQRYKEALGYNGAMPALCAVWVLLQAPLLCPVVDHACACAAYRRVQSQWSRPQCKFLTRLAAAASHHTSVHNCSLALLLHAMLLSKAASACVEQRSDPLSTRLARTGACF